MQYEIINFTNMDGPIIINYWPILLLVNNIYDKKKFDLRIKY